MGFTALHILWLVPAFTLTAQELQLSVSPKITAECGKRVTLQCNVSSALHERSIKLMEWSHNRASLCSVNGEGNLIHNSTMSGFHCEYKNGQLSVIFPKMQPPETVMGESYMCKLQSTHGVLYEYTTVELQECVRMAKAVSTSDSPVCVFSVHPDGDVHWFHGSRNLSDGSVKHHTTKGFGKGGWLIVNSHLERKSSDVPYNCSLMSSISGRYIASALVQGSVSQHSRSSNGIRSRGPVTTILCIIILLADTMKW